MDISLWILLTLTVGLLVVAFAKNRELPGLGLLAAAKMLRGVWLELALGFVLAGLLEVLIPKPMLATWLGDKELGRSMWWVGVSAYCCRVALTFSFQPSPASCKRVPRPGL
jgi:hypothetical protein